MNPFVDLAKSLSWEGHQYQHICDQYTKWLQDKLDGYCCGGGDNATSLKLLIEEIRRSGEIEAFARYPYVADQLHPRTRIHDDCELATLVGYALSFLVFLGMVNKENQVYEIPKSYQARLRNCSNVRRGQSVDSRQRIAIYLGDTLVFPDMTEGNTVRPLSETEASGILGKIDRGFELFEEAGDSVVEFVSDGTELLCVQNEIDQSNRFGSASFRGFAGLNLILNPGITSTWTIADAILHESIHSILYQIEPYFCPFFDDRVHARQATRSPWTGNSITVDNLFQAIYVWFGLLSFWRLVAAKCSCDLKDGKEYAADRTASILRGFSLLELDQFGDSLATPVRLGVETIIGQIASLHD